MITHTLQPVALACCIMMITPACVSTEPGPEQGDGSIVVTKEESLMERIDNPVHRSGSISFSVISNGCTNSSHFELEHAINNGRCELTVIRTTPDFCRKASSLMDVELMWDIPANCKGMEVVFLNPQIGKFEQGFERTLKTE